MQGKSVLFAKEVGQSSVSSLTSGCFLEPREIRISNPQLHGLQASPYDIHARTVLPPCFEEGHPDESNDDAMAAPRAAWSSGPARPSDVKRRRPESAARSRASSVPEVLRRSGGWVRNVGGCDTVDG